MKIKIVDCLEWRAPDKPGQLLRFASEFKKRGVNLDMLWRYGGAKPAIGAAAKRPAELKAALKALGVKAEACRCFFISGADAAGVLVAALEKLAAGRVNVECSTALAAQGKFGAMLWVQDRDLAKARRLLKA